MVVLSSILIAVLSLSQLPVTTCFVEFFEPTADDICKFESSDTYILTGISASGGVCAYNSDSDECYFCPPDQPKCWMWKIACGGNSNGTEAGAGQVLCNNNGNGRCLQSEMGESAEWHIDRKRCGSRCGVEHSSNCARPVHYNSVFVDDKSVCIDYVFKLNGIFQPFIDFVIDVFVNVFFNDFLYSQPDDSFNFGHDFGLIFDAILAKCDYKQLGRRYFAFW
ncbi:hypothetical protein BP6252_08010 [Coleophoma cylindrospora]|uniref:Uncharacterized protein n=1 Tax=Coleophoma cylindrospora TaxID=1849047 RepID=A0A3D8RBL6_9HELO|nr:hypothetical protein BP6252_08010 [Coleophoma cylindrospora]